MTDKPTKPRKRWTDADRLAEQLDRTHAAESKAIEERKKYDDMLRAAHERAKAAVSSLPTLAKETSE